MTLPFLLHRIIATIPTLCLALLLSNCSKENDPEPPVLRDQLPPLTQTGAYTFGCLLNGEVWIPKSYSISVVNPPVVLYSTFDSQKKIFGITAYHWRKDAASPKERLAIFTPVIPPGEMHYLTDSIYGLGASYQYSANSTSSYIRYDQLVIGKNSWIQFSKFDTLTRIASGTFSIDLVNIADIQDTVFIRDGRFDVPF